MPKSLKLSVLLPIIPQRDGISLSVGVSPENPIDKASFCQLTMF
jgi:hypothetical protein